MKAIPQIQKDMIYVPRSRGARRSKRRSFGYFNRLGLLVQHPFFWLLTLIGNLLIVVGSLLLYFYEGPAQMPPLEWVDAVLWSTSVVTTIGLFNLVPITFVGKVTIIAMMLTGTLFVWTYMAFLVTALIAPELSSIEKDVNEVERELMDLKKEELNISKGLNLKKDAT